MFEANQTLKFLNLLYLKGAGSISMIDIDWRKIKVDVEIFDLVRLERLLASKVLVFLNQLYLK